MLRAEYLISLALLTSCASLRGTQTGGCTAPAPATGRLPTGADIDALGGQYRLVQVTTSFSDPPRVTLLTLAPPDSAERVAAKQRRIGHSPRRDLRLVGRWQWSTQYPALPAEWDAGTLYLDCRDCVDGSPDELQILTVEPNGFAGTWRNPQSGIAHGVDRQGHPLPDPAGYFCATRVERAAK